MGCGTANFSRWLQPLALLSTRCKTLVHAYMVVGGAMGWVMLGCVSRGPRVYGSARARCYELPKAGNLRGGVGLLRQQALREGFAVSPSIFRVCILIDAAMWGAYCLCVASMGWASLYIAKILGLGHPPPSSTPQRCFLGA